MTYKLDIELDAQGKHFGTLSIVTKLPDSTECVISSPLISVANGEGPTVVMTAGVHGDEYEGQVALSELCRDLRPENIRGRLIIMPTANASACLAGQRNTPVDGLNLNRAFPGKPDGSFTSQLAYFIENELYQRADYAVDFHGGGVILNFLPATLFVANGDPVGDQARFILAKAFGAPYCMLFDAETMGVAVGIDGAMLRKDIIGISGEYGGSAEVTPDALDLCRSGIGSLLAHLGVFPGTRSRPASERSILVDVRHDECYVVAQTEGVFEPIASLGEAVTAGDPLARIHRPNAPREASLTIPSPIDGIVMARRALARSSPGDWLFIVGCPVNELLFQGARS